MGRAALGGDRRGYTGGVSAMWPVAWREAWQARWRRWLARRIPPSLEQVLSQRNIFIFPTSFGAFYLLVTALLFTIGLNYQNNSVYAFCFFLVAVFVAAIMPTFNNLQGLKIRCKASTVTVQGRAADVVLYCTGGARERFQLLLHHNPVSVFDMPPERRSEVHLSMSFAQPGVQTMSAIKLHSVYPLGLYRAWTWLSFSHTIYVAPRPRRVSELQQLIEPQGRAVNWQYQDNEERELREYRQGDSARDIFWRRAAGEGPLLSKTRGVQPRAESPQGLIDYHRSQANLHRAKLADLCYWVLHCDTLGVPFGLSLPSGEVPLGSGAKHKARCLQALAEAV